MAKICTDQSYSATLRLSNRATDDDLTVVENGDSRWNAHRGSSSIIDCNLEGHQSQSLPPIPNDPLINIQWLINIH